MTRQIRVTVSVGLPNRTINGMMSITCKDVPEQFKQDAMGLAINVMQQMLNDPDNSFLAVAVPIAGTEQVTLSLVAKSVVQTIDVNSAIFIDEPAFIDEPEHVSTVKEEEEKKR